MTKEQLWQKSMDFFAPTCHQKSERSFFFRGWQLPFCARCTGMYLGYGVGIVMFLLSIRIPLWIGFLCLLVMFLDWFLQFKKILMSNNSRRFLTGILAGIAILQLIGYGLTTLFG